MKTKKFDHDRVLSQLTKHRDPVAVDAKAIFMRGQQKMQSGSLKEAYEYIAESVNLMTSVYGAMHPELAQALRSLARLSYILGELRVVMYFTGLLG